MKYLVCDAGNSRVKWGVYEEEALVHREVHPGWNRRRIEALVEKWPGMAAGLGCSVRGVPDWLGPMFAERGIRWQVLRHDLPLPIRIGYETPETLGVDRIAAAAGAASLWPGRNVLAIDAGTALTFEIVTADGYYPGGAISPGLRMRFSALSRNTHALPEVDPGAEVPLIGRNTREAILAGVVNGMVNEIDNSINSLKNKYNDLSVILTGGDARYLSERLKNPIFVEENLVLSGLCSILRNFSKQVVEGHQK